METAPNLPWTKRRQSCDDEYVCEMAACGLWVIIQDVLKICFINKYLFIKRYKGVLGEMFVYSWIYNELF